MKMRIYVCVCVSLSMIVGPSLQTRVKGKVQVTVLDELLGEICNETCVQFQPLNVINENQHFFA
jgi:hypothetical protein